MPQDFWDLHSRLTWSAPEITGTVKVSVHRPSSFGANLFSSGFQLNTYIERHLFTSKTETLTEVLVSRFVDLIQELVNEILISLAKSSIILLLRRRQDLYHNSNTMADWWSLTVSLYSTSVSQPFCLNKEKLCTWLHLPAPNKQSGVCSWDDRGLQNSCSFRTKQKLNSGKWWRGLASMRSYYWQTLPTSYTSTACSARRNGRGSKVARASTRWWFWHQLSNCWTSNIVYVGTQHKQQFTYHTQLKRKQETTNYITGFH